MRRNNAGRYSSPSGNESSKDYYGDDNVAHPQLPIPGEDSSRRSVADEIQRRQRSRDDRLIHLDPVDEFPWGFDSGVVNDNRTLQTRQLERRLASERMQDQFRARMTLPSIAEQQRRQQLQNSLLQEPSPARSSMGEQGRIIDQQQRGAIMGYGRERGNALSSSWQRPAPPMFDDRNSPRLTAQHLQQSTAAGLASQSFTREWHLREDEIRRMTVWLDALRGERATRLLARTESQYQNTNQRESALRAVRSGRDGLDDGVRSHSFAREGYSRDEEIRRRLDALRGERAARQLAETESRQKNLDNRARESPKSLSTGDHDDRKRSGNSAIENLKRGEALPLAQPTDKGLLSEYQLLIRESLSLFQMKESDIRLGLAPGRKIRPTVGQIGVCCRYCAHVPFNRRSGGAVYFPSSVSSIYQAAQNIAANHLMKTCPDIPPSVKKQLFAAKKQLKEQPRRSGGNTYWMETCQHLGLVDHEGVQGVWCGE